MIDHEHLNPYESPAVIDAAIDVDPSRRRNRISNRTMSMVFGFLGTLLTLAGIAFLAHAIYPFAPIRLVVVWSMFSAVTLTLGIAMISVGSLLRRTEASGR